MTSLLVFVCFSYSYTGQSNLLSDFHMCISVPIGLALFAEIAVFARLRRLNVITSYL